LYEKSRTAKIPPNCFHLILAIYGRRLPIVSKEGGGKKGRRVWSTKGRKS